MSDIRSKYPFLAMANVTGGGVLVVVVYAFSVTASVWLGFAVSIALLLSGCAMVYSAARDKRSGERIGIGASGSLTGMLAAWTIIASLVFAPATARWLIFASACAYVGLSMISLVIREVTTKRVAHHLDVEERAALAAHQTRGRRPLARPRSVVRPATGAHTNFPT